MQVDRHHERQLAIVRNAGHDVERYVYNSGLLQAKLKNEGILDSKNGTKFSLDEKTSMESFLIYARFLKITDGEKPECWRWRQDLNDFGMETAEAKKIKLLEVKGGFFSMPLPLYATYQVAFRVRMAKENNMEGQNVKLQLRLPDGAEDENEVALPAPATEWTDLVAGTFVMTIKTNGRMNFAMEQNFSEDKHGLVIKGAVIKMIKPPPEKS